MSKYKITYFLNTACAERRPTTREDVEEDWIEEEKEFDSDLDCLKYIITDILDEDIEDYIEDDNSEVQIKESILNSFKVQDWGFGEPIIIKVKGGKIDYDTGTSKEDFLDEVEDDEDWEELDESKKLNEDEEDDNSELEDAVQELMEKLIELTGDGSWDGNDVYDNCVILEGDFEDDYIEVFVYLDGNGKKHYTINDEGEDTGTKYYSIEDVVKNLPELDKDYSQEIYYWESVLLDLEKHGDWSSEEHENAQEQLNHYRNLQHGDDYYDE